MTLLLLFNTSFVPCCHLSLVSPARFRSDLPATITKQRVYRRSAVRPGRLGIFSYMGVASVLLSSIILVKAHAFCGVGIHSSTRSSHGGRLAHAATGAATKWTMDNRSFRTEVHVPVWPEHAQLGYQDSFFLLGSCFSDNISTHLRRAKLPTSLNPAHGASVVWRCRYGGVFVAQACLWFRALLCRLPAACEAVHTNNISQQSM